MVIAYKKIVCTILLLMSSGYLIAYPFRLRRIILTSPGNKTIIKTIDLIYDTHIAVQELVKNPSRGKQQYLAEEEKEAFTTAERTLLITLRRLAEQKKPIELLWEYVPPTKSIAINDPIRALWLRYGHQIMDEFSPDKKKSLVFKSSDTYRISPWRFEILLQPIDKLRSATMPLVRDDGTIEQVPHLNQKLALYTKNIQELYGNQSKAFLDLQEVQNHAFKTYDQPLSLIWQNFSNQHVKPLYVYFTDILTQNPDIEVLQFRQSIEQDPIKKQFLNELYKHYVRIADAEFLIKIFASDYDHTIMYAGANHCDVVSETLINQFGGKAVTDLGSDHTWVDSRFNNTPFLSVLSPRTWSYVVEDPQKSLQRFKEHHNKPLKNLVDPLIKNQFEKLRDHMMDLPQDPTVVTKSDNAILKQLEDFYTRASKTFVDFINVRDGARKTLLYYAVQKNLLATTEFLLKHNARVNIQDYKLNTPLHSASSQEMVQLLLEHGAKLDIKNDQETTAEKQLAHLGLSTKKQPSKKSVKKSKTACIKNNP